MARQNALNIHDTKGVNALLAEKYGGVIENISTGTVSGLIKNKDLSGDPNAGSVEAKKLANAKGETYGTARAGGKANGIKAETVTIKIDTHEEFLEEVEEADASMYGVDGLIDRRNANISRAVIKSLEKKFWNKTVAVAKEIITNETSIIKVMDAAINTIETTKNEFVDGVDRDMIHFVVDPTTYTAIQEKLDEMPNGSSATGGVIQMFHNVKLFRSTDLPTGVKFVIGVDGSVAQAVRIVKQEFVGIPLSKAYAYGLYVDSGTQEVMPELIYVYKGIAAEVKVASIGVVSESGNILVPAYGTVTMLANVSPANATNKTVTWSVINGTGSAEIDADGVLTALTSGTVNVKATAKDGSGVEGTIEITIAE